MHYKSIISKIFIYSALFSLPILTFGATLYNPLGSETNPIVIIANITKAMLGVLGAVTLLMFIYGGFVLIFSGGNEERLKKGRSTLIWAIIGLAIALSSYSILNYLFEALTAAAS